MHKMAVGSLMVAASYLLVALAEVITGEAPAHWLWLLSFFVIFTLGELYILPTGLGLFATALRNGSEGRAGIKLVDQILQCTDSLERLFDNLLDISRLDAGQVAVTLRTAAPLALTPRDGHRQGSRQAKKHQSEKRTDQDKHGRAPTNLRTKDC